MSDNKSGNNYGKARGGNRNNNNNNRSAPYNNNNGSNNNNNNRGGNGGNRGPRRQPQQQQQQQGGAGMGAGVDQSQLAQLHAIQMQLAAAQQQQQQGGNFRAGGNNTNAGAGNAGGSLLDSSTLKVSAQSNPKGSAGSIAHTLRRGLNPTVMCTGQDSINQAVKALAIARSFLEEDKLDLSVSPSYREQSSAKISLKVTSSQLVRKPSTAGAGTAAGATTGAGSGTSAGTSSTGTTGGSTSSSSTETKEASSSSGGSSNGQTIDVSHDLKVAHKSDPGVVAGAIAKKVRNSERPFITCIGASSVSKAVFAIITARKYLQEDAIDISFRPEFIHLDMEDGTRSAIRFAVLRHDL